MRRRRAKNPVKATTEKVRRRQHSILLRKEVFIFLFVIVVAGTWKFIFHEAFHDTTPASVLTSEWKRYAPGGAPLSLLLPSEPRLENTGISEVSGGTLKQAERYHLSIEKIQVALWNITYADGVSTDIGRAADGAAEALRQSRGVTEYQDERKPIVRSGRQGVLVTGRFARDGEKMSIEAALLGEGEKLWQVIITRPAADRNGSLVSKRILDSIQIESKK